MARQKGSKMKAYVINLDRRDDRLERAQAQAAALGFDFVRVSAVDGSLPAFQERAVGLSRSFLGDQIGPYTLACFESHRKVWRALLESEAKFALVMEDDLVLAEDFATFLEDTWVPDDADIVRLETYTNISAKFDLRPVTSIGQRRLHRLRSTSLNAGAYVVSRRVVRSLLEQSEEICDPVDAFLFHQDSPQFARLATYQMIPAPAIQGNRLAQNRAEAWAYSSLEDERQAIALERTDNRSHRRSRLRRRFLGPIWKFKARLQGVLHTKVPFG
jgi:glycosyl transferase family 25